MATITGTQCTFYYGTSDPGATELARIRDVTVDIQGSEIDVTTRDNAGWSDKDIGLLSWSASTEMVRDTSDSTLATLWTAFTNKTRLYVVMEEPAGGVSLSGSCKIRNMSRSEPLDDVVSITLEFVGKGALTQA